MWHGFPRTYPDRFSRQRIIGQYIVDFYCAKAKFAVELDGSQHYEEAGLKYDVQRTSYLEKLDLKVPRFSNSDIKTNFEGVCLTIDKVVKSRIYNPQPPAAAAPFQKGAY